MTHPIQNILRTTALALFPVLAAAQGLAQPGPQDIHRGPINLAEVVRRATVIVRATVASSRVQWVDRTIYTFHDMVVGETVKGAARTSITIAIPGGTIGNVRTIWPGAPRAEIGDELVFFGAALQGGPNFTAVGLFDGLVKISTDRGTGNRVVAALGHTENIEDFLTTVRALSHQ